MAAKLRPRVIVPRQSAPSAPGPSSARFSLREESRYGLLGGGQSEVTEPLPPSRASSKQIFGTSSKPQSALTFALLIVGAHSSISLTTNCCRYSGDRRSGATTLTPSSFSRCCTDDVFIALRVTSAAPVANARNARYRRLGRRDHLRHRRLPRRRTRVAHQMIFARPAAHCAALAAIPGSLGRSLAP